MPSGKLERYRIEGTDGGNRTSGQWHRWAEAQGYCADISSMLVSDRIRRRIKLGEPLLFNEIFKPPARPGQRKEKRVEAPIRGLPGWGFR